MLMDNENMATVSKNKAFLWKVFLYAMIGFFAIDVIIGIIWVLSEFRFGEEMRLLGKIGATSSILGLFCLLTMNNVLRYESKNKIAKVTAIIAIIMNVVWVIAWILIVWDCFDGLKANCGYSGAVRDNVCMEPYDNATSLSWKMIGDGVVLSIFFTTLASYLSIKSRSKVISAVKIVGLVSGGILAIYLIGWITFRINTNDVTGKLSAIAGFIYAFCAILVPVLLRGQKKKDGKNEMVDEGGRRSEVSEAELREKIEKEVRAKIEAENKAKSN